MDPIPTPTPAPPTEPTSTPAPQPPPNPEPPASEPAPETAPEPFLQGDALVEALGLPKANPTIEPAPEPAAEPSPTPSSAPPAPSPAPTPTPVPEPPPARKKKSSVVKMQLDTRPAPEPPPPPAPAAPLAPQPPPATDPDEAYVSGLTDEQKEELREAAKAEEMFPERYRGRRKQLIAWYRQLDSKTTELLAVDPNRSLDENDEDLKKFVSTRPQISPTHSKKVQREMAKEEAARDLEQKMAPKLEQQRREHLVIKRQPRVDAFRGQFVDGFREFLEGDGNSTIGKALKEIKSDPKKADDYALETSIYEEERERAANLASEYYKFIPQYEDGKLVDPGLPPDLSNPLHKEIYDFVNQQGQGFATNPAAAHLQIRNGKRFLPREQFFSLPQSELSTRTSDYETAKYWTFSHMDVVNMLAKEGQNRAEARVQAQDDYNKRMGYERKPKSGSAKTPNPTPTPSPEPIAPPRATPSRGKVPGTPSVAPPAPTLGEPINVSEVLGYNKLKPSVV